LSGIKKIGLFGGTFDPPHIGHLKIIKESLFQLQLDKLYVVVSGNPWMKGERVVASKHQRQEMVEIAFGGYKKVCLLKLEINKDSPSYSYQTLEYLKTTENKNEFYFIVGSDAALSIDKWKKPLNILTSSKIVCVPRNKISNQSVEKKLLGIYPHSQIQFLKNVEEKISSTEIRKLFKGNETVIEYFDYYVYTYILKNDLYF
tara:strand:- start:1149 stop:1754 length:606 start_codon:yes stop_codon:yes gene_type:complete